jgi:hypothetical protein
MKRLDRYVTVATEKNLSAKREKYEAYLKTTQPEMKKYRFRHSGYRRISREQPPASKKQHSISPPQPPTANSLRKRRCH